MGRNTADALCVECGKEFMWLIGTPQIFKPCLNKKKGEEGKNG